MTTLRQPRDRALHQVAIGAADIEECAVAVDRGEDEAAGFLPLRGCAGRNGLRARGGACQVGGTDDRADPSVPFSGVDFVALVSLLDRLDELPAAPDRAFLQRRARHPLI